MLWCESSCQCFCRNFDSCFTGKKRRLKRRMRDSLGEKSQSRVHLLHASFCIPCLLIPSSFLSSFLSFLSSVSFALDLHRQRGSHGVLFDCKSSREKTREEVKRSNRIKEENKGGKSSDEAGLLHAFNAREEKKYTERTWLLCHDLPSETYSWSTKRCMDEERKRRMKQPPRNRQRDQEKETEKVFHENPNMKKRSQWTRKKKKRTDLFYNKMFEERTKLTVRKKKADEAEGGGKIHGREKEYTERREENKSKSRSKASNRGFDTKGKKPLRSLSFLLFLEHRTRHPWNTPDFIPLIRSGDKRLLSLTQTSFSVWNKKMLTLMSSLEKMNECYSCIQNLSYASRNKNVNAV